MTISSQLIKELSLPEDVSLNAPILTILRGESGVFRYGMALMNLMESQGQPLPYKMGEELTVFPTIQSVEEFFSTIA